MATARAKLSYLRIAPRKVRLIADMLRRKKTQEAEVILNFTVKKGSKPFLKLLKSAIANAENNLHLDPANLYISKISVDEGPKLKRFMPRARGSASPIQKKTSNILIVLDEIIPGKKAEKKEASKAKKSEEKIQDENKKQSKFNPEKKEMPKKEVRGLKRVFQRKSV